MRMKNSGQTISLGCALAGTVLHTCVDYLAPLFKAPRIEVAEVLGEKLAPSATKPHQLATGMLIHFVLGALVFPTVYNIGARHVLPRKPMGPFVWAMLLWLTGQTIIMPLCDTKKKFVRKPKRVLTYWLAHVAYALPCCKLSKS